MKLVVSTLVSKTTDRFLDECVRSVRLPPGAAHVVTACDRPEEYQATRWSATTGAGAEYVAWVDADDVVIGDALERCVAALDKTGAAIAFTDERLIDEDGRALTTRPVRTVTRRDIAMHPRGLHHLAVVRTEVLHPGLLACAERIGLGIDWLMKAYAALAYGAVHVPVVGYGWRQHPAQMTHGAQGAYAKALPELRSVTAAWLDFEAPVPRYEQ